MRENGKNSVVTNLLWRAMERFGAQGITLVVLLVLARLLDPEAYGVLAIVTVFTVLLEVFLDSGLGNALIQKKDADDLDFSSVFYVNIVFSLILYFLLFSAAPLIAKFYDMSELTALVRVLGLVLIISGMKNVQQAYVSRNMMFKKFFFSTLGGTLVAAVVGITIAYLGFGVWALVAQLLVNNLVDTAILWLVVPWRPKWMFSWQRFMDLFSYGWKLLASSMIYTINGNLRQLIVGKLYTTESLAFYNQGDKLPAFLVNNINTAIDSVLLSTLSAEQDDAEKIKIMTRRSVQICSYVMWPMMLGVVACAEPFVALVLTEKWLPCVPFMQIFCVTYALLPIYMTNMNAIKAVGHSEVVLKLEITNKLLGLTALLLVMRFGPFPIALSTLASSIIAQIISVFPNRKLFQYTAMELAADILPSFFAAAVMCALVYAITILNLGSAVTLLLQIPLGVVLYVAISALFQLEPFCFMRAMLKDAIKKRK